MRKITDCPGAGASNPTNTHGLIINGQTLVDECLMDVLYSMQELAEKANIIRNDKQDNYLDGYQIYQAILALCRQNTLQERSSAVSADDFKRTDFNLDGGLYELDLSDIIPVGVKSVLLRVLAYSNPGTFGDGGAVSFGKTATANNVSAVVRHSIINTVHNYPTQQDITVFVDDDSKIVYSGSETGVGLTDLTLNIAGWSF